MDQKEKPGSKDNVRHRPDFLRALGVQDPPTTIQINNIDYHCIKIYKHDSWAATALYQSAHNDLIVAKFNRQQSIFGIPMQWLGRWLGQRENKFLQLFADLKNIPHYCGEVYVNGTHLPNVSAHTYLEATSLRNYPHPLHDDFFPKLQNLLKIIHQRDVSYMDINKLENILVDAQGEPHLIDFQICFFLSKRWPGNSALMRAVLRMLQKSDDYHLMKHYTRLQPQHFTAEEIKIAMQRPWFIRVYRCIQIPIRTLRRQLLVLLKVRNKSGQATSEAFVEEGLRAEEKNNY